MIVQVNVNPIIMEEILMGKKFESHP